RSRTGCVRGRPRRGWRRTPDSRSSIAGSRPPRPSPAPARTPSVLQLSDVHGHFRRDSDLIELGRLPDRELRLHRPTSSLCLLARAGPPFAFGAGLGWACPVGCRLLCVVAWPGWSALRRRPPSPKTCDPSAFSFGKGWLLREGEDDQRAAVAGAEHAGEEA